MLSTTLAITVGAAIGAMLRWTLGMAMNALFPPIPLGTLSANLIAAYVVGLAIAYFGAHPAVSTTWRLLIITGFAGGLSTFSSFSAELLSLLQEGRYALSAGAVGLHLGGSVLMTTLGILTISLVR